MRDYNGRHSFLLAWARFGRYTRPAAPHRFAVKGYNMRHAKYFSQDPLRCNEVFVHLKRKLHNKREYKKGCKICMRAVDSWKLPIMVAINHVLRCLNLACTLLSLSSTLSARRALPAADFEPCLSRKTLTIANCKIIQQKEFLVTVFL